jgi:hypothetical protein
MENQQQMKLNIDFNNTTGVESDDGNVVFQEGFVLRKVSKFVTGTQEDGIIPIPVFYDVATGKILKETLPKEIRKFYEDESTEG